MADYRSLAIKAAKERGVDPELFTALIQQESGFNPTAESPVGAYGLTQVMPATAADPGWNIAPLKNRDDPNEQIRFGADYLDAMLDRYGGSVPKALAAYNWGAGNADDWNGDMSALPEETRNYISTITGNVGGGGSYKGTPVPAAHAEAVARSAGLGDDQGAGVPAPPPSFFKDEYADNMLGKFQQKNDTWRAGLGDKLGLDPNQMNKLAGGLAGLGSYLSRGGFG